MKALVFDNYLDNFKNLNQYLKSEVVEFEIIKFKNGEGKIVLKEDIKDEDVMIFSDFSNKLKYKYKNQNREYSSDEYNVELKRLISACSNAKSISLFLPCIYEGRQNSNKENESKDYLLFIKELKNLGVDKIITFEVHGKEKQVISYSLAPLFENKQYDVVVSPDEGGVKRSIEYSNILKCDNYHFSKTRNLKLLVNGTNPINSYNGSNYDFTNKRVLIVDDILDSGSTLINAINSINNASCVDIFIPYAFFSNGVKQFKKLVKEKHLNKIYISNAIYNDKAITKLKFIEVIDCNEYLAHILKDGK